MKMRPVPNRFISATAFWRLMATVVYSSSTGSTRKYAEAFASRTGMGCIPVGGDVPDGDIVFFGWFSGPRLPGSEKVDGSSVVAVMAVGLSPELPYKAEKVMKVNGFPPGTDLFYATGWVDRERMPDSDRRKLDFIMKLLRLVKGRKVKPLIEIVRNGGSLYDEALIEPMVEKYLRF